MGNRRTSAVHFLRGRDITAIFSEIALFFSVTPEFPTSIRFSRNAYSFSAQKRQGSRESQEQLGAQHGSG